jgi:hypothetical protein
MMEPTVTQNGALYFAQHKILNRRDNFFRIFRAASKGRKKKEARVPGALFVLPKLTALDQH